jgi:predicted AlkP superfamily phosphohydrolase/phosphomutase
MRESGRGGTSPPRLHVNLGVELRVLVIGLDGGTFDLIRPFIEQGHLPTLKRLMAEGSSAPLESTVPPVTASAWSSFMTGKNPGAHGLFDFMQRRAGSYDLSPVSSRDRDGKAVWEIAGDAGKQVVVMGVPVTYPPSPVNGLMVTGMLTPRGANDYTFPPKLKDEIRKSIGEYTVYSDEVYSKGRGEVFLGALHKSIEQRAKAAAYLLHKYPWDLGVLVFPETDTVSHGLWSCYDRSHHQYDPEEASKFQGGILEIYDDIDSFIGELTESLGSDTTVIVMSDHGHGPVRNFLYVNNFLMQKGYLRIKRTPASAMKNLAFALGLTPRTVYRILLSIGLGKLRRTLDKRRSGRSVLKRLFLSFSDVDWRLTRAYSIGYIGEVHVNLKGREPEGNVEPGAEYEELRHALIRDLRSLRLPNGNPLVEYIWKKEEIYHGPHMDQAPDILFLPTNLETIAFGDFEFGSNRITEPSYGVSSSHRMKGIFIASGPSIRAGASIENAGLIDLAPTILHLLGLPVPLDMDGRVLSEALLESRAVEFGGSAARVEGDGEGYSDAEAQEVMARLKDLGYIS